MNTHGDEIRLLGIALAPNETLPNCECPHCLGGTAKEKSFSVTRTDDGFMYNCYRASCDMAGFVPEKPKLEQVSAGKPHIKPKKTKEIYKTFDKCTFYLTVDQYAFFQSKFNLTVTDIQASGVKYCAASMSYIFPIFNRHGLQVGVVDRAFNGRTPKALTILEGPTVKLYFPKQKEWSSTDPVVVVEDVISAIRVSKYKPCVALLGCSMSEEAATVLRKLTNRLVIALDNDATSAALKLSKQYKWMFDDIIVQHLSKDPKDMSDKALEFEFDREYEL